LVDLFHIYNRTLDELITFDKNNADYLIDDNGLSWGEVSSDLSVISNLDGYGATLNAVTTIESRIVDITGWVMK
jgi:hypothetical protein